jgi:hypothetical protein
MVRDRLGVSERWACRVVGQHRSTQRYEPIRAADDAALRRRLREISAERPRWGYRRAHYRLRQEGWEVNRKRVQRLWREEGLRVPVRRRKRQPTPCRTGAASRRRGPRISIRARRGRTRLSNRFTRACATSCSASRSSPAWLRPRSSSATGARTTTVGAHTPRSGCARRPCSQPSGQQRVSCQPPRNPRTKSPGASRRSRRDHRHIASRLRRSAPRRRSRSLCSLPEAPGEAPKTSATAATLPRTGIHQLSLAVDRETGSGSRRRVRRGP